MEGRKEKKVCVNEEGADRISKLPDALLAAILSLLPADEAVRTSVLSQRWTEVWRYTSHLSFDQKLMSKAAIDSYVESSDLDSRLERAIRRARTGREVREWDAITEAARSINSVLDVHYLPLTSCRIQHMVESCASGDAALWMRKLLVEKKVRELSMERDVPEPFSWHSLDRTPRQYGMTLNVPFEIFSGFHVLELKNYQLRTSPSPPYEVPQNLKTLKLTSITLREDFERFFCDCLSLENLTFRQCRMLRKLKIHSPSIKILNLERMVLREIEVSAMNLEVMKLDSVVCRPKSLVIVAPNLKVLHCYSDFNFRGDLDYGSGSIRLTREILEACTGIVSLEGSSHPNIFENLVSLYTELDLKNVKDVIALFSILRSCRCLQNLEINNQFDSDSAKEFYARNDNNQDACLPYPSSMFWTMREFCECVSQQLKTVYIKGYKGKELEVEFVKYLITTSEVMERITIWFDDDCTWEDATATVCLLSYPKTSANLSITLKPGKEYLANVGGRFQNWISTLKTELVVDK